MHCPPVQGCLGVAFAAFILQAVMCGSAAALQAGVEEGADVQLASC